MVRQVLAALVIQYAQLVPLSAGLASEAWRVGQEPWFALHIAREWPGAGSNYEMEHAIMDGSAEAASWTAGPGHGSR